jgi:hypothetical protein
MCYWIETLRGCGSGKNNLPYLSGQDDYSWLVLGRGGESQYFRCLCLEEPPKSRRQFFKIVKNRCNTLDGSMARTAHSVGQVVRLVDVSIPALKRMNAAGETPYFVTSGAT